MFEITKTFEFSAAHQLSHLPAGHKCANLHGHNYTVIVRLRSSELNADGFVRDFGELDFVKQFIDGRLDHRNLNEVLFTSVSKDVIRFAEKLSDTSDNHGGHESPILYTTSETIAILLWCWIKLESPNGVGAFLHSVTVSETPKTSATYALTTL